MTKKYKIGDVVRVISTKNTNSTGMVGKIYSDQMAYFYYCVEFFYENPDGDTTEPFEEYELEMDKNYIVKNIINDL